jgi:hypothetical protein
MLATFMDFDPEQASFRVVGQENNARRSGPASANKKTAAQPLQAFGVRLSLYLDEVAFFDLEAGVREAKGQFPVIGQEEEPLALKIQPADGEDPLPGGRKKIFDRRPMKGVFESNQITGWLIQDKVNQTPLFLDVVAVDLDPVLARVDLGPELPDDSAVDKNSAFYDQSVRFAPRGHTGLGEILV